MIITRQIEIDGGHRVPNHKSKCRNIHGHRYKIEAGVEGIINTTKGLSEEGMVMDFGDLKEIMMNEIHNKYDHSFIMYNGDRMANEFAKLVVNYQQTIRFVPFIPTAENLAKHFYELLHPKLERAYMDLNYVRVWETPNSTALYRGLERKVIPIIDLNDEQTNLFERSD